MTTIIPPRFIELSQLEKELAAAGIIVRGLVGYGPPAPIGSQPLFDRLMMHNAGGSEVDLPPGAAAVIAAHVPQPTEAQLSSSDLAANLTTSMARLNQIINNTPTNAQVVAAVQDLARYQLRILRYIAANWAPR